VNPDVEYYHHQPQPTASTSKLSAENQLGNQLENPFCPQQAHRMSLYHQVQVADHDSSERNRWERKTAPVNARANKNKNKSKDGRSDGRSDGSKLDAMTSSSSNAQSHYKRHRDRDSSGNAELRGSRQVHKIISRDKERRSSSSDIDSLPASNLNMVKTNNKITHSNPKYNHKNGKSHQHHHH